MLIETVQLLSRCGYPVSPTNPACPSRPWSPSLEICENYSLCKIISKDLGRQADSVHLVKSFVLPPVISLRKVKVLEEISSEGTGLLVLAHGDASTLSSHIE